MKFEDEFPSLKGKEAMDYLKNYDEEPKVKYKKENSQDVGMFLIKDIQEHCFDKQKVRCAIDKLYPLVVTQKLNKESINDLRGTLAYAIAFDDLKKELGL